MRYVPKYILPRIAPISGGGGSGDEGIKTKGFVPFKKEFVRGKGRGRGWGGRGRGNGGRGGKKSDPLKKFSWYTFYMQLGHIFQRQRWPKDVPKTEAKTSKTSWKTGIRRVDLWVVRTHYYLRYRSVKISCTSHYSTTYTTRWKTWRIQI